MHGTYFSWRLKAINNLKIAKKLIQRDECKQNGKGLAFRNTLYINLDRFDCIFLLFQISHLSLVQNQPGTSCSDVYGTL